jgi:hypothetical protein
MIISEASDQVEDTNFKKAYNSLVNHDKHRVRYVIEHCCGISEKTFYRWLDCPEDIKSKNDKRLIAIVLDKEVTELF